MITITDQDLEGQKAAALARIQEDFYRDMKAAVERLATDNGYMSIRKAVINEVVDNLRGELRASEIAKTVLDILTQSYQRQIAARLEQHARDGAVRINLSAALLFPPLPTPTEG